MLVLRRQVGAQRHVGPYHFRAPPVYSPPLHPPSRRAHPVSAPSPFSRKRGRKRGSALPPPALSRSPAPPFPAPPPPPPHPACTPSVRPSARAAPHPACTPSHAGGRADRASPIPFRSRAGPSAWAAPPPARPTRHPPRARPPFTRMRGEGQCAPPLPFAPPPRLHSTPPARPHTLGAGRTERAPSLSIRKHAPPPGLIPLRPACAPTAAP